MHSVAQVKFGSQAKAVGMTLAFGNKEGRLNVVKGILVLDAFALAALLAAVAAGITPLPLFR